MNWLALVTSAVPARTVLESVDFWEWLSRAQTFFAQVPEPIKVLICTVTLIWLLIGAPIIVSLSRLTFGYCILPIIRIAVMPFTALFWKQFIWQKLVIGWLFLPVIRPVLNLITNLFKLHWWHWLLKRQVPYLLNYFSALSRTKRAFRRFYRIALSKHFEVQSQLQLGLARLRREIDSLEEKRMELIGLTIRDYLQLQNTQSAALILAQGIEQQLERLRERKEIIDFTLQDDLTLVLLVDHREQHWQIYINFVNGQTLVCPQKPRTNSAAWLNFWNKKRQSGADNAYPLRFASWNSQLGYIKLIAAYKIFDVFRVILSSLPKTTEKEAQS